MDARAPRDARVIAHVDVPRKGGRRGEEHAIAEDAVVRDMAVRHDEAFVAERGDTATSGGPAAQVRVLGDAAALADDEDAGLACVLEVLRDGADSGKRADAAVRADGCPTGYTHVRLETHTLA